MGLVWGTEISPIMHSQRSLWKPRRSSFGQGVSRTGLGVLGVPARCEKPWQATPRGGLCLGVHDALSLRLPVPRWSLALEGRSLWKEGGSDQE